MISDYFNIPDRPSAISGLLYSHISPQSRANSVNRVRRSAFTLIELLVVLFIFLLLSAVALPTVKNLLADQKVSKTARSIAGFFSTARSRAIAEGRYVGVRIERLNPTATDMYGNTVSTRLRQLIGTPPYSGESSGARVQVQSVVGNLAILRFSLEENQLLSLNNQPGSPFRDKDIIEFPGGKHFHIQYIDNQPLYTEARINLRQPLDATTLGTGTVMYPAGNSVNISAGSRYPYRIHRNPVVSSAAPIDFVRGVVLDLNYSGIGTDGFLFGPTASLPSANIDILFGPDGRVEFVTLDSAGTVGPPAGLIFLLLGDSDGVRLFDGNEATMFTEEGKTTANVLNSDSVWLVINPNTGRVVAAPLAQASDTTSRANALPFARSLALLSDTLDAEP